MVQTSNIERADPRVAHHVYQKENKLKKKQLKNIAFVDCLLIGGYSQLFWPWLFEDWIMLSTVMS